MTIIVVILTIQRNIKCAKQVQKHLQNEHEFPKPEIRVCPSAPPRASNRDIQQSLSSNHFDILKSFSTKHHKKNEHIVVCEDDCEFTCKDKAFPRIKRQLEYLDKHYQEWTTFHIGHCPLGPIFGTTHSQIVHTMVPYMAHCYAVNGYELSKLLVKYPNKREWKRPQAIEGWLMVPWRRKFAMFPAIATQNRMPKEVQKFGLIGKIGLTRCLRIFEQTMMYSVSGICVIVLFVIMIRLFLRK